MLVRRHCSKGKTTCNSEDSHSPYSYDLSISQTQRQSETSVNTYCSYSLERHSAEYYTAAQCSIKAIRIATYALKN